MSEPQNQQRYVIGQLRFDAQHRMLSSSTEQLYLEPQAYQLLLLFISADQGLLSRDQLIEQLWAGRVVSESAINKAVSLLRKALAQLDPHQPYLETLPKVGYRLCQPVQQDRVTEQQDKVPEQQTDHNTAVQSQPLTVKAKLILALLWVSPLLFFVLWFFITLRPAPEQLPSPYLNAPVPVSYAQGIEYDLSLSLDGTKLLYLLATQGNKQLMMQLNSEKPQPVLQDPELVTASLSPDGQSLLWVKQNSKRCEVQWLSLKPSQQSKTLMQCSPDSQVKLSWQKDSKGFYWRDRADKTQPYALYRFRLDSAEKQQITNPLSAESPAGELAFSESDDGSKIAVIRYLEQQQSQLVLLDGKTFAPLQQITLPYQSTTVNWLGQKLLLSKDAELFSFDTTTQQSELLFYTGRAVQSVALFQQQIYYADYEQDFDIWQHDLAQNKNRIRIGSSKADTMPRVNQRGDLAFLTQRHGKEQIWLQPAGQNEYLLADLPGQAAFVPLQWSPDGESLLFSKDGALWQLTVASGQSRMLLTADKQVEVANWTADGNIVFSSKQSGDWQLWRFDPVTAQIEQLTQQGGYRGYLQRDVLYFSKFHQDGLFMLNLKTQQEMLLIDKFNKINWLNWTLSGDSIYYYQPDQGLYQYSISDQRSTLLLPTPERFVHHYAVQNQQLFYVKAAEPKGDIYKLVPVSSSAP